MLSPKTPLFSFMIERLFHQGIVARGIRDQAACQRSGMLRPSLRAEPLRAPYMISRPPARSRR